MAACSSEFVGAAACAFRTEGIAIAAMDAAAKSATRLRRIKRSAIPNSLVFRRKTRE
jgi:hypothetical protein